MVNFYWPGQTVRLTVEFRDEDDALADPATARVQVILPDGTEVDETPVNDAVGLYHFDVLTELPGRYQYRFEGTGSIEMSGEHEFRVRDTDFTP